MNPRPCRHVTYINPRVWCITRLPFRLVKCRRCGDYRKPRRTR
jgi:hypothetical protein